MGPESQGHRWSTSSIWAEAGSIPSNSNNKTKKKQIKNKTGINVRKTTNPEIYILRKNQKIY